ncbi:MAG TPA: deoxyribodipyrimidine photo-lyase, partial [Beijerinckiaceae bacterium]
MASVDRSAVVWFRDDLRLADQPALRAALDTGRPVVALYVHDEGRSSGRALGGASRWWLHHSLAALGESLETIGGRLDIVAGEHADMPRIVAALDAACVFWTRRYGGADVACDAEVKARLVADGVEAHSFNGQLLREPWEVSTKAGTPMRVFTPFWRAHQALGAIARPLPAPRKMKAAPWPKGAPKRSALADLDLLPIRPDWAEGLRETWTPGERGAEARLARFLDDALAAYAEDRDRPDKDATSQLSPHLRFGEISPRRVWAAVKHLEESKPAVARPAAKFLSELGWREFSYHLLFHHPDLATR